MATASGNHWVVMGLAIRIPGAEKIHCLPIHARLHLRGKKQPSETTLAGEVRQDMLQWFSNRQLPLLGVGACSAKNFLGDPDERIVYVGRMRADGAVYDPTPSEQPKSKPGPKPRKGPRLPSPRQAISKADRNRSGNGRWALQWAEVTAYGVACRLQVLSFQAV